MAVVVFLRGMNLGNRRITNSDLVTTFQRLGYGNPTPYQASGNVILPDSTLTDFDDLEAGLTAELGYEVPVFLRLADQVREIANSPFTGQRGIDGGKPQIVFLRRPGQAALTDVFGLDDRHELIGTEIHWLPRGGLAETGDLHKRLDLALGPTTVRTLGTIERIVKKLP